MFDDMPSNRIVRYAILALRSCPERREKMTDTRKPLMQARVDVEELELVKKIASQRGEDVSDFVRRAVRRELATLGYLSQEETKALGLIQEVKA